MQIDDLRDYIDILAEYQEVQRIGVEVDWNLEMGAITRRVYDLGAPAALFDNIKGFPRGYRVSSNTMSGIRRMALGLGLDPNLPNVDLVKAWKEKLKTFKPLPPNKVKTGPVLENVFSGKDVDLLKFPAPKWHEPDGGRILLEA